MDGSWNGRKGRWITRKIGNRYKRIFIPDDGEPMFERYKKNKGKPHPFSGISPKDLRPEEREKIRKINRKMDDLFKGIREYKGVKPERKQFKIRGYDRFMGEREKWLEGRNCSVCGRAWNKHEEWQKQVCLRKNLLDRLRSNTDYKKLKANAISQKAQQEKCKICGKAWSEHSRDELPDHLRRSYGDLGSLK